MTELNSAFIEETKQFVLDILDRRLSDHCLFHSKNHTLDVFKNVCLIGTHCDCSRNELFILQLSALFHDIGYIKKNEDHESLSATMASEYLTTCEVDKSVIEKVGSAIMSTKVPQSPTDILSMILCDADLMHLSYDNYFELMELMREEWKRTGVTSLDEKQFHLNSLVFFKSHSYHTPYGRTILESGKMLNLERIKSRIAEL